MSSLAHLRAETTTRTLSCGSGTKLLCRAMTAAVARLLNLLLLNVQVPTDPHNGHTPAANGVWISVYRGHQSAAQARRLTPSVPCLASTGPVIAS